MEQVVLSTEVLSITTGEQSLAILTLNWKKSCRIVLLWSCLLLCSDENSKTLELGVKTFHTNLVSQIFRLELNWNSH